MNLHYADLELSLRRISDSDYAVDLRFRPPDSAANVELITGQSPTIQFNLANLLPLSLDAAAYGKQLTDTLFTDPRLTHAFARARTQAETADVPLRIALHLDVTDYLLQALRWETLHDPERGGFLFNSERILLTRYLDSPDLTPVKPKSEGVLRALIAVASPTDLADYQLAPIDVAGEVQRAQEVLCNIPTTVLTRQQHGLIPTLNAIIDVMREGVDILYLVAHGTLRQGTPYLWLEDASGSSVRIEGTELTERISQLNTRPLLVVLVSCQSAGSSHDNGTLTALGPQLARAGIAAIVAMQDSVSMDTTARFMPTFFRELQRDGVADRALAAARAAVANRFDWWMPVLFLRLRNGRLFNTTVLPKPACPYAGMAPFRSEDARFFYGREEEIDDLLLRLRNQRRILVTGPSGSGKSSLLSAGVLPRLPKTTLFAQHFWLVKHIRLSDHPLTALAEALECEPGHAAASVASLLARSASAQRLLLVIDQFEELFALTDQQELQHFVGALQELQFIRECTILLAMRADFYSDLMNSDLWSAYCDQRVEVVSLCGEALRAAIERPAAQVGVTIDPDLLERLLADAANEPGVLPLMQETMVYLWDRMAGRRLTYTAYQNLSRDGRSGLAIAIAARADGVIAELSEIQRKIARRTLLRLIQFGEGRADTRRQQTIAMLRAAGDDAAVFNSTLKALTESRLLTITGKADQEERRVDLSHDTLIIGWPALQGWLRERREAELTRRRLEEKAAEWVRLGRGHAGLLDDVELVEAKRWLESESSAELGSSTDLSVLIQISQAAIDQALQEREMIHQRELDQAQALAEEQERLAASERQRAEEQLKATKRVRTRLYVAIAFAAIAIIAAALASYGFSQAQDRLRIATSRQLAAQTFVQLNREPDLALLLGLEAYHTDDSIEARSAMLAGLTNSMYLAKYLHSPALVSDVSFSPNGKILALAQSDHTVTLWDIETYQPIGSPLIGHTSEVYSVDFSPDGKILAAGSRDNTIILWDVATGEMIGKPLKGIETMSNRFGGILAPILDLAFSPDGSILATGGTTLMIWDMHSRPPIGKQLDDYQGLVSSIAISPDGRFLAADNGENAVVLWDLKNDQVSAILPIVHNGGINSVAFSPDGSLLASGDNNGTVILWDVKTRRSKWTPIRSNSSDLPTDNLNSAVVAFSSDGQTLIVGSADGSLSRWDVNTLQRLGRPMRGGIQGVVHMAVSSDGHTMASVDETSRVILWDLTASQSIGLFFKADSGLVRSIAFQPNSAMLTSGHCAQNLERNPAFCKQGEIRFWNTITGKQIGYVIQAGASVVWDLAFSPDGQNLASGGCTRHQNLVCQEGIIRLWDVATRQQTSDPLIGHTSDVTSLAFSPDGSILASGGNDNKIILWDMISHKPLRNPLSAHTGSVDDLAFSPNGQILASASRDNTIILWDVATGQPLGPPLRGHTSSVISVAFSPDGKILASGSGDQTIRLWDVIERKAKGAPLVGHTSSVFSVAFDPDGTTLASGGYDGIILLWDVATHRPLDQPLIGHHGPIYQVTFNPDSTRLASASMDQTAILWDLSVENWQTRICQLANRNLSWSEWARYMPTEAYRKTCPGLPIHTSFIEFGRELALAGDIEAARTQFRRAQELEPALNLDPESELQQIAAQKLLDEGRDLARAGRIDEAVATLRKALDLDPSLTLKPEEEVRQIAIPVLTEHAIALAKSGDIDGAVRLFEKVKSLNPEADYDSEEEAKKLYFAALDQRAEEFIRNNRLQAALDLIDTARADHPTLTIPASSWNTICWFGGLNGHAAEVLEICNRAVADAMPDEEAYYRDSRGMARALTGDLKGAIEDFQVFVNWTTSKDQLAIQRAQRQAWIDNLRAGRNPFDEALLVSLQDGSDVSAAPVESLSSGAFGEFVQYTRPGGLFSINIPATWQQDEQSTDARVLMIWKSPDITTEFALSITKETIEHNKQAMSHHLEQYIRELYSESNDLQFIGEPEWIDNNSTILLSFTFNNKINGDIVLSIGIGVIRTKDVFTEIYIVSAPKDHFKSYLSDFVEMINSHHLNINAPFP